MSNRCQHFPQMQRSRRQRRCKPRLAQGSEAGGGLPESYSVEKVSGSSGESCKESMAQTFLPVKSPEVCEKCGHQKVCSKKMYIKSHMDIGFKNC